MVTLQEVAPDLSDLMRTTAATFFGASHIHSVWHDYRNDFARDLLGIHYREQHHGQRQVLRSAERPGQ